MRVKSAIVIAIVVALVGQALAVTALSEPARDRSSQTVTAADRAIAHVREHRERFDLSASDLSDLVVTDLYRSPHNGLTHVYLRQRLQGLEVIGTTTTVNVTDDGRVLQVGSRFISGLHSATSGTRLLDADDATRAAASQLDLSPGDDAIVTGTAELVYQPTDTGAVRLAWNLQIAETSGDHWWNVSVDAATGDVLTRFDYVDHDDVETIASAVVRPDEPSLRGPKIGPAERAKDGSSYRVYAVPLESPNDGKRTVERNPADRLASPYGWHDFDGKKGYDSTTTNGNNTHAYTDYTGPGNQALPLMDAEGGEGLDFIFPVDFELPPHTYRDAAVTNLFYWNNVIHDVFYRYGFTERAGNFQMNNYRRGGKGDDPVMAEAQDAGGVNNANFATPEDGTSPRMQMYIWPGVNQVIDGDFDSGVITHEYAHGISNRLTGGPDTGGCLSSHDEREGEGWSDFLAIALTARKGERGVDPRGMGTYVLGQSDRKQKGIRPTPYSTNKGINPSTYNTIKGAAEPHGVGYVWATMLWEVYWKLVKKHGFNPNPYDGWRTGGNNLAIQLVMDGMKIQPCEPGFVDARDAIIAADKALTGGRNRCQIWTAFAKRGLGYKAKQNDPASKVDGVESYKTHPKCR